MPSEIDNKPNESLAAQTFAWCERAEAVVTKPSDECRLAIELVREGILLRRRWDRADPEASRRREVLRLLPAVQTIAQHLLAECIDQDGSAEAEVMETVEKQLAEDDRYLVGLLDSQAQSPESTAFEVECFRDDLHWQGTLVAVLNGSRAVDFLGRIMLEEEALERELEAWEEQAARRGKRNESQAVFDAVVNELHPAARRLRLIALSRQADALLDEAQPDDTSGWYCTWQAAGRLAARVGPDPAEDQGTSPSGAPAERSNDELPASLRSDLYRLRDRAAKQWGESLEPASEEHAEAVDKAAKDLADTANELLTFLEDLPLDEAVRSLEIVEEDIDTCLDAVKKLQLPDLKPAAGSLRRCRKTVAGELQERRLAWRMEGIFGRWFVTGLERLILGLLLIFCLMMVAEGPLLEYEAAHWESSLIEAVFAWFDLGICMVFLAEFTLKISLARRRMLYFRRNWITGLLPSIPVGFFAYAANNLAVAQKADWFVSLRMLRYLRLPRMARWLRIARPVVRIARLVGFMLRASDRLVRQLAPLLNRNLLLFERADVGVAEPEYRAALGALRERFYYRAAEMVEWLPLESRANLVRRRIDDLSAMLSAPQVGPVASAAAAGNSASREIPFDLIIARLLAATPANISDRIGRKLAQSVSRWCGAFDMFGVRRLPFVRDLVSASRLPSPYDTTAVVANRIGQCLSHLMDRIHWLGDLYGIVTAPQLVDSMGEYMVKGAARPAKRLVMVGIAFWIVSTLGSLIPVLAQFSATIERLFAWPLILLGGICLAVFGVGRWFRQIAGEATEFYDRVAEAQFIAATARLKRRFSDRQYAVLQDRVIDPELKLADDDGALHPGVSESGDARTEAEVSRAAVNLLWQDYLDSAPFNRSDTRTTTQLLGNLAIVSLRESRLGYTPRQKRRVERLDLSSGKISVRGPYLWFHFISRSLAQQTAKLVESYNAHVLPLSRAGTAEDWKIRRHVQWLAGRLGCEVDELPLGAGFQRRWESLCEAGGAPNGGKKANRRRWYQGNDFTAMHFLSADEDLEEDVRRRYGDAVVELIRQDRRDNIRRVFCTYPCHAWPKQQRTINPFSLYGRHFAGGRMLLLPFKLAWLGLVLLVRGGCLLRRFIREVLHPSVGSLSSTVASDPFEVARRKIHRMRKPLFMECLRMRADFDPEYLGIIPPGPTHGVREAAVVQIEEDLALIEAEPSVRREFRDLANRRRRQMIDFRRWSEALGIEGYSGEAMRAMAIAYSIDYMGVRSRLEAVGRVREVFDTALADAPARKGWGCLGIGCFRRLRRRGELKRLFKQPAFSQYGGPQRKVCLRSFATGDKSLLVDIRAIAGKSSTAEDPVEYARKVILSIGRDPHTWSRQLLVLRAVQTLSVLDLSTYCDLVAELGEYDNRAMEITG
jgi:ion transport protein